LPKISNFYLLPARWQFFCHYRAFVAVSSGSDLFFNIGLERFEIGSQVLKKISAGIIGDPLFL
jgi:hypothetical protein